MLSNSTGVNGDPGTGGREHRLDLRGDLDLDRPLPRVLLGVDHLDHPQRQAGLLVELLDHLIPAGPLEVPHHLHRPGRVCAAGERLPRTPPRSDL